MTVKFNVFSTFMKAILAALYRAVGSHNRIALVRGKKCQAHLTNT